ncbi:methyltransferase FkbM domain containing protein [Nitzschia inconspicua]|uniref:Methyltransferase FkbM domain containing protein n=1 Tax=Nitzschia inconspicua TaxID=303405 RepID=A0A9K3Q047_9STRA|nr:methyltransferase FkbM domain containing protein [Nitzschia inconspicua]
MPRPRLIRNNGGSGSAAGRSSSFTSVGACTCMVAVIMFALMNIRQSSTSGYIDGTLLRMTNAVMEGSASTATTTQSSTTTSSSSVKTVFSSSMKEWRESSIKRCKEFVNGITDDKSTKVLEDKEQLEKNIISKLSLPSSISSTIPPEIQKQPYARCKNVFIDLGTNIGDSVGYFIDNAIDSCSPLWVAKYPRTKFTADFPRPHLDVTTVQVQHKGNKGNPLFGLLQKQAQNIPSESFCVYGMEGNPTFTERLRKLENYIREMQPRPVQHLHIFTESVVTAQDGPTKLYLDKTSVEQNFWGSSILSSQQDAVKSANELNKGQVFSADVMGISLSSMVKNTVLAFKEGVTDVDKQGGLLIIKMDVEGAEYQVLKEVAETGILCEYAKMGNRVVFVVEYHNMSITDPKERRREQNGHKEALEKLKQCGVDFQKLQAIWA